MSPSGRCGCGATPLATGQLRQCGQRGEPPSRRRFVRSCRSWHTRGHSTMQAGNEAIQLDTAFHNLVFDIEGRLPVVEKHIRVRLQVRKSCMSRCHAQRTPCSVTRRYFEIYYHISSTPLFLLTHPFTLLLLQAWLRRLAAPQKGTIWKRNRNAFARLLFEMLRAGRIAEPFDRAPPEGPLPKFNPETAYLFRHDSPVRQASPGAREGPAVDLKADVFHRAPRRHVVSTQPVCATCRLGSRQSAPRGA